MVHRRSNHDEVYYCLSFKLSMLSLNCDSPKSFFSFIVICLADLIFNSIGFDWNKEKNSERKITKMLISRFFLFNKWFLIAKRQQESGRAKWKEEEKLFVCKLTNARCTRSNRCNYVMENFIWIKKWELIDDILILGYKIYLISF